MTSTNNPDAPGKYPKTWAGVAGLAIKTLGIGAPFVIILGLFGFAWYKYQQLEAVNRKIENETAALYDERLNEATERLLSANKSMGDMTEQQIRVVHSLMELHDEVTSNTAALKKEAEQATIARDEANRDAIRARAHTQTAIDEFQMLLRNKADLKRELVLLRRERDEFETKFAQQDRELDSVTQAAQGYRKELAGLTEAIIDESGSQPSKSLDLARDLGSKYTRGSRDLLTAFSANPGPRTAEALSGLIGLPAAQLEAWLRDDLGYEVVTERRDVYGLIREVSNRAIRDSVIIVIRNGAVASVETAELRLAFSMPLITDWSAKTVSVAITTRIGTSIISLGGSSDLDGSRLNEELVKAFFWPSPDDVLFGVYKDPGILELAEFRREFPELYEAGGKTYPDLALVARMIDRAERFDPRRIPWEKKGPIPSLARRAFLDLLDAAVKGDFEKGARVIDADLLNAGTLGRIAAAVLRPDFLIEFADYDDFEPSSVQSKMKGAPPPVPRTCMIATRYTPAQSSGVYDPGELGFLLETTDDGRWVLTDLASESSRAALAR